MVEVTLAMVILVTLADGRGHDIHEVEATLAAIREVEVIMRPK